MIVTSEIRKRASEGVWATAVPGSARVLKCREFGRPSISTLCRFVAAGFLVACSVSQAQESRPASRPIAQVSIDAAFDRLLSASDEEWQAGIVALIARIDAHENRAARLLAEAKTKKDEAAREAAAAERLRREQHRLTATRRFFEELGYGGPAAKSSAAPVAEKPPATSMPTAIVIEPSTAESKPVTTRALKNFDDHVLPIFRAQCFACHRGDDADGGLDVSQYAALMKGGGSGVVVKPKDAAGSRLYRVIAHLESPFMPKDSSKMDDADLAIVKQWIDDGAHSTKKAAETAATAHGDADKNVAPNRPILPPKEGPTSATSSDRPIVALEAGSLDRRVGKDAVRAIAVDPFTGRVYVGKKGAVAVFEKDGRSSAAWEFAAGTVQTLELSRDGDRLLAAGGVPGVRGGAALYDTATGAIVRRFGEGDDMLYAAAISPGQSLVAVGGEDRLVRVFLTSTGAELYRVDETKDWVLDLDFSPDGNLLAAADRSGGLYVDLADTGRPLFTLRGHDGAVEAIDFRPDARSLASVGDDGTLRLWELEDGKESRRVATGDADALAVTWCTADLLAVAGTSGIVRFYRAGGDAASQVEVTKDWIYTLSPLGPSVLAGTFDGRVFGIPSTAKTPIATFGD